jgi:hypothetical protein
MFMVDYFERAKIRFWEKVKKDGPEDCWIWLSVINHEGYGRLWFLGRFNQAHRLSWEFTNGPIPEGRFVCHKCDNPTCVNPAHLFLGTNEENMMDCFQKGRRSKSGARLKPPEVEEIRRRYSNKEASSHKMAKEYGVSKTQILRIVKNRCWQHIEKGLDLAYGNYQVVTNERFPRTRQRHR